MKAFKKEIYLQCDLMAIKKRNVASVHRRISQHDSGERCGPWPIVIFHIYPTSHEELIKLNREFMITPAPLSRE
jgi:hypothetical protein